jgi:phosphoenolpyruvate carboxykinase (ATP)
MPSPNTGLDTINLSPKGKVHWNLRGRALLAHAARRGEGEFSAHGAFVAITGERTGRSANDKWTVKEPTTEDLIWWDGTVNRAFDNERFELLRDRALAYLAEQDELFVQDLICGAERSEAIECRVVTMNAWHAAFARNMFVRPNAEELKAHRPEWTVIHAPHLEIEDWKELGLNSQVGVLFHPGAKLVVICGTRYAGEIKKSIFSAMNLMLPGKGILPMHCSANTTGSNTAVFFGLSGTGKTTLSADPKRALVGDDEHGWGSKGVFNFEGGCYAKMIKIDAKAEPEIFATSRRFGTILENVILDSDGVPDFDDNSLTENTRGSYPLEFIDNRVLDSKAGQPQNVVFLCADAFGVLPPVSKLTPEQAAYHFVSGYTAKVAGTEIGVKEPVPAFSACFGAPFMPRHPSVYADLLSAKIEEHGCNVWLLNTGWIRGPYGEGDRISIRWTRTLLNAALDGTLDRLPMQRFERFGFQIPTRCPGVPSEILHPRNTWRDKLAYDAQAERLVAMYLKNFEVFAEGCKPEVLAAAPRLAADDTASTKAGSRELEA